MAFQVPTKMERVFGSRTRAKVLGYLAESSTPQTGYAISKSLGIGVAKTYQELKNLDSCGVLVSSLDVRGRKRYVLGDEDLRNFLVRNLRILPASEWFAPDRIAERRRIYRELRRSPVRLPATVAQAGSRAFADEFRRPAAKDRALNRLRRRPDRR